MVSVKTVLYMRELFLKKLLQLWQRESLLQPKMMLRSKVLFEQWAGASDGEDQYQQFEDAVADALDSIGSADGEVSEDPVFSSKVWVNADNKIVGREFAVIDGAEITPVFTWKAPSDGDTSALLLEITAEGFFPYTDRKRHNRVMDF